MRLYCCPSYLCLYYGGALPALLCFFMTDVSALSAARLSPTSVARFRFGFLCRDGTWFVSRLLVFIVKARTHDRLFACIRIARRMTVWLSAAAPAYLPCALVPGVRSGSAAGQCLLSCLSRFPMADLARRGRTIFGIRQKCRARHAPHYWRYAWRSGSGSCLRIDFITLRCICQSGTFPST